MSYAARVRELSKLLRELESVAVAFSGGVDSSVLLHAAHAELADGAAAVIADSPSLPRTELEEARETAEVIGARLIIVSTDELTDERYRANSGDRCYWCKTALFRSMAPWAQANGFRALAFGEIADDLVDDRPGARAAAEFGVVAPLSRAGFSKEDVRRYAREAGLPVAEKPSSACLASRIPVGTLVTRERLARIEAVEQELRSSGLCQIRVRDHGNAARIEVDRDDLDLARTLDLSWLARHGFDEHTIAVYVSPFEKHRAESAPRP